MKEIYFVISFFRTFAHKIYKENDIKSRTYIDPNVIIFTLQNLPRFVARTKILNYLQDEGLLNGDRDHGMSIPLCSRTGDVIEPLPKPQWFLRYVHTYYIYTITHGGMQVHSQNFIIYT